MQFSSVVGHNDTKRQLIKLGKDGRVPHAILFGEEQGYGALPLSLAFAQYLSCPNRTETDSCGSCPSCNKFEKLIHPDLHFAFPVSTTKKITSKPVSDNFIDSWRKVVRTNPYMGEQELYDEMGAENKLGNIGVAEASLIFRKLSMTAFEGGNKYMVIWLAERMNQEASNKLLKLLEEPPKDTYLFLISQSVDRILPTILSRCRIIKLSPIDRHLLSERLMIEFGISEADATLWAKISGGSLSRARRAISESQETSAFDNLIADLINGCLSRELMNVISVWEEVALLTRERQRDFCYKLIEYMRRTYILSLGSEELSYIPESQRTLFAGWSKRIKPAFYEKGFDVVNKAITDIERSVNSKYIFADLSNRFFLSL